MMIEMHLRFQLVNVNLFSTEKPEDTVFAVKLNIGYWMSQLVQVFHA